MWTLLLLEATAPRSLTIFFGTSGQNYTSLTKVWKLSSQLPCKTQETRGGKNNIIFGFPGFVRSDSRCGVGSAEWKQLLSAGQTQSAWLKVSLMSQCNFIAVPCIHRQAFNNKTASPTAAKLIKESLWLPPPVCTYTWDFEPQNQSCFFHRQNVWQA